MLTIVKHIFYKKKIINKLLVTINVQMKMKEQGYYQWEELLIKIELKVN